MEGTTRNDGADDHGRLCYSARMTYNDFVGLCKQRRSIRYFADRPVDKADVLQLLELANSAPSVENLQPWHFHVVYNHELRRKLMETSCYGNFVEGAGVFIVVTSDQSVEGNAPQTLWNPRELEYSCVAAMEHILLGATAMGLGSSWVSLHHGTAHDLLRLPHHHTVVGGIMLGYYREGENAASDGKERKPTKATFTMYE